MKHENSEAYIIMATSMAEVEKQSSNDKWSHTTDGRKLYSVQNPVKSVLKVHCTGQEGWLAD
jgi:hypothetical protein